MSEMVLLYDGICGLCHAFVRTVLEHDRRRTLRFAALQSAYGRAVRARHALDDVDSLTWVTTSATGEQRVAVRSTAVLEVASYLGGWWRVCLVAYLVPRRIRDFLYAFVARRRYRVFGRYASCPAPSAALRTRFLD